MLEVLARVEIETKGTEIKGIQIRRKERKQSLFADNDCLYRKSQIIYPKTLQTLKTKKWVQQDYSMQDKHIKISCILYTRMNMWTP